MLLTNIVISYFKTSYTKTLLFIYQLVIITQPILFVDKQLRKRLLFLVPNCVIYKTLKLLKCMTYISKT